MAPSNHSSSVDLLRPRRAQVSSRHQHKYVNAQCHIDQGFFADKIGNTDVFVVSDAGHDIFAECVDKPFTVVVCLSHSDRCVTEFLCIAIG